MASGVSLEILSEKTLHHVADPRLVTYCPYQDLIALVSTEQQVFIYRLNGQRVYGAAQKAEKIRVDSIRWKPNGQLLASAWSDGSVRLVGAESSKVVHHFTTSDQVSGITCVGWVTNLTNRTSSSLGGLKNINPNWQSFLEEDLDGSSLDLPRDLSLIDIESSLPKLSTLVAGSILDDIFSSRVSLDTIFRPFDPKDNDAVDVMVVGTESGRIHISIYDSFVIGSFTPPLYTDGTASHLIRHASQQQYSTHALLMRSSTPEGGLFFVPMDLRFISASSENLSLLASRSTALQNLLRYIRQVQVQMVTEWKASQDLPSKFLRNINETLAEKDNRDIVQALYHSVATGHTFPSVREWLVDELQERGYKRWEKAVTNGLENLRRLVHESMLPALERCSVILSRFAGIAKFQGSNNNLGYTSHQISLVMDSVACLRLVSSKILIQVVDELELFSSFSSWLRYEIERLASDRSSSPSDDAAEKESTIDHSKVLLYLQTIMISSPLAVFLGDPTADEGENSGNHAEQGLPLFDFLNKQLQKQENGLPYMTALPRVEGLCSLLTQQANSIFDQIAEAEKRNVLFGKAIEIGNAEADSLVDMRMSREDDTICQIHILFVPKGSPHSLQIIRITLAVQNGISSVQNLEFTNLQLGNGWIKDLKLLNDKTVLLLWELRGTTRLLYVPYTSDSGLKYSSFPPKQAAFVGTKFSDNDVADRFSIDKIISGASFIPEKIEVRESSQNSKEDTSRVFVLGKGGMHYKVLKTVGPTLATKTVDEDVQMSQ